MENPSWSFEQQELARELFLYKDKLKQVLRRFVFDETVVDYEDLFQEALIKAVDHSHQFRGDARVSSWFTRIAINELKTVDRKQRVRRHILMRVCDHLVEDDEGGHEDFLYFHPDPVPNPEEMMITKNLLAEIKHVLSEDEWWLIEQRHCFGKQNFQIANETGIDEDTLKVKAFRARYKLELFGILPPNRILGSKQTREKRKPKTIGAAAGG